MGSGDNSGLTLLRSFPKPGGVGPGGGSALLGVLGLDEGGGPAGSGTLELDAACGGLFNQLGF